jgi:hypothetical protein
MTVSAKQFAKFPLSLMNKEVDLNSDTIKCALFTSAHAPAQATDQYYDAAHGMTEVSAGGGYATGGAEITSPSISTTDLTTTFDGAHPSWTITTGFTWRYACFYDDSPASNKPLISYLDMGTDQVWTTPGVYGLNLNAAGIASLIVD